MDDDRHGGDAFTGYRLRVIEERIETIGRAIFARLARLEQKIDALGQEMTPAERAALIAAINADTAKLNQTAESANALADKLDQTGV